MLLKAKQINWFPQCDISLKDDESAIEFTKSLTISLYIHGDT